LGESGCKNSGISNVAGLLPYREVIVATKLQAKNHTAMATFSQGILGGFSGKVGNIVGSSWKGTNVMKIRPSSVTNPNTVKQQNQRLRFALVGRFLQAHRNLVNIGFNAYKPGMSATNAAMSYNLSNAITGEFPDLGIDFSKVQLSRGSLNLLTQALVTAPEPSAVLINWSDNSGSMNALDSDQLSVGLFDPESGDSVYFINCASRADANISLGTPAEWSGRIVQVLAFLSNETSLTGNTKRQSVSNTQWIGSVELV
jgi:hypothetical protein